ncbi:MAG TPA: ribosome biogenesis GTPase Der [Hyphomicrobiaceae bacterium]|jgi:GTP-binding protein|nr:ribosome biogenesis GTPase Der [Hyphomicrobiaceae bacterium]
MPATIAIVGRPNVGKSTLFNRLTGRRTALVSDTPGLTRDRRTGEAMIAGHPVTVIDTAGLEEGPRSSLAGRMRTQSELALTSADLVLFVFDARDGIIPADAVFARLVLAAGVPAILVANKCEGRAGTQGFYEAFQLGLGEPIAISAEHGEGMGELSATIAGALGLQSRGSPQADAASPRELGAVRVAIVGRPNAGKSTLVNALLGEERMITGPEPGLTRDAVASDASWQGRPIRLFDTAGLRRKARVIEAAEKLAVSDAVRAIRFAEVVILLIDAEHPFEHQDLTIADLVETEGRALIIAVNKWDLVSNKQAMLKGLRATAAERLAQMPGVAIVPISALAGRGLDDLMSAVFETYAIWNKRVSTPALNRWLAEAVEQHAPAAAKGRRVKLRFVTQPSARPPTFIAFCSRPEAVAKAYVRYLSNSLRATFGFPGVPIRLKLRKSENPFADR